VSSSSNRTRCQVQSCTWQEQGRYTAFYRISKVYKELGIGVWLGTRIRESLKAQGFLVELELRTGTAVAGRPGKVLIPTFSAFELLETPPPKGRGGSIHRYIQQAVADGARAKGYSVQCEHILPTGGIADAYLEKGTERIAVEIAVLSTPEREIAHIRLLPLVSWRNRTYSIPACLAGLPAHWWDTGPNND
jgi:hypothetical protein